MNNQEILGMNSAHEHAKQCAYGANMSISAALVVDMAKRIAELEKDKSTLLSIYKQFETTIYDCTITDEEAIRRLLVHLEQSFNIVDPMVQEHGIE